MHTVFINTAVKPMQSNEPKTVENPMDDHYPVILDVPIQRQQLYTLDCPFEELTAPNGFVPYADRIGEAIDSYERINNDYNLVIYVDLLRFDAYAKLERANRIRKMSVLKIHKYAITRLLYERVYKILDKRGRAPREAVIIFEENFPEALGGNGSDLPALLLELLGLPSAERMGSVLSDAQSGDAVDFAALKEELSEQKPELAPIPGAASCYSELVEGLYGDIAEDGIFVEEAIETFRDGVEATFTTDSRLLCPVDFVTDRLSEDDNKQKNTRRDLRLYFYLLECIQQGSLCEFDEQGNPFGRPFPIMTAEKWDAVVDALAVKYALYYRNWEKVNDTSGRASYADLKLVPKLFHLDTSRFGMTEFGLRDRKHTIVDLKPDDEKKPQDGGADAEEDINNGKIITDAARRVVLHSEIEREPLFTEEQYKRFEIDVTDSEPSSDRRKNEPKTGEKVNKYELTERKYSRRAEALNQLHKDFPQRLHGHALNEKLPGYVDTVDGTPPLLEKRKLFVPKDVKSRNYSDQTKSEKVNPKSAVTLSDNAYSTARKDYLRFCAGRAVELTDISPAYSWFSNTIGEITVSLKRLGIVAIGMLAAILLLYIPFLVLQWGAITQNLLTVSVALSAIGVPVALLCGIVAIMSARQRRRYEQAWQDFKAVADAALAKNKATAKAFDDLLTVYIPTLRWVYEYKLDVNFYLECSKLAKAKLAHHEKKLWEYQEALKNIIEDLEHGEDVYLERIPVDTRSEIDYSRAYCSGNQNTRFYTVVESELLEIIRGEEG